MARAITAARQAAIINPAQTAVRAIRLLVKATARQEAAASPAAVRRVRAALQTTVLPPAVPAREHQTPAVLPPAADPVILLRQRA